MIFRRKCENDVKIGSQTEILIKKMPPYGSILYIFTDIFLLFFLLIVQRSICLAERFETSPQADPHGIAVHPHDSGDVPLTQIPHRPQLYHLLIPGRKETEGGDDLIRLLFV